MFSDERLSKVTNIFAYQREVRYILRGQYTAPNFDQNVVREIRECSHCAGPRLVKVVSAPRLRQDPYTVCHDSSSESWTIVSQSNILIEGARTCNGLESAKELGR